MTLDSKQCIPCRESTSPMPAEEAQAMLKELKDWHISSCGKWLRKYYKFSNFVKALAFTNQIGAVAEAEGHHPDLKLGWGYVDISLQTHAAGGLHSNDFILAAKIDNLQ